MAARRTGRVTGLVVAMVCTVVGATVVIAAAGTVTKGGPVDQGRWLGSRTTEDGVTLRLHQFGSQAAMFGFDEGSVPADCFADVNLNVGVSTARIAQETGASFFRADTEVRAATTVIPGDRPVQVVIVQAPKGAARAVARFSDGSRDEADAMGRYFVLARQGPRQAGDAWGRTGRTRPVEVVIRDTDGDVVDRKAVTDADVVPAVDFARPECQPSRGPGLIPSTPVTQPLPEPVGDPPADEDAARAAITAAFEGAYPAEGDIEAALANVEGGDSAVVREARMKATDANPQYVGRVTALVNEVRFLDQREAAVRFEFRLDGQPFYSPQVGFAVLTPDGWKMSRSTYCDQLQTAGPNIKC